MTAGPDSDAALTGSARYTACLMGTFVLDPVATALDRWLRRLELAVDVEAAPYGHVVEALRSHGHSRGDGNRPEAGGGPHFDVGIVLLRPEDLLRAAGPGAWRTPSPEDVDGAEAHLAEIIASFGPASVRSRAAWLLAVMPTSPAAGADPVAGPWVRRATEALVSAVDAEPMFQLVDVQAVVDRYRVREVHDEFADRIAHLPYSEEYTVALGTQLARSVRAALVPPRKVVVLDCDNTLWQGVCAERGPLEVDVTRPFAQLQRFMLAQRNEGMLLCLCSHNDEADVREIFSRHPDMVLRWEHITAHRIGWRRKPDAVVELAEELGLSVDSFVFVDDDPLQRELMRRRHPGMAVVDLPTDPERFPEALDHCTAFDRPAATDEDRQRARRYQDEQRRRAERGAAESYEDFLLRCEIRVSMEELDGSDLERAAQLSSRTNQFNTTGVVLGTGELAARLGSGAPSWMVRVKDRFGDYGKVGLVVADIVGTSLRVESFLLSCRVLNRRVEYEVLDRLLAAADSYGLSDVCLRYRRTARNEPAREFMTSVFGVPVGDADFEAALPVPSRTL